MDTKTKPQNAAQPVQATPSVDQPQPETTVSQRVKRYRHYDRLQG